TTAYTLTTTDPLLNYGSTYYWCVQAADAAGNLSAWSSISQFTVSVLLTPANNSSTLSVRPTFTWHAVTGATYLLEVANDPSFAPANIVVTHNTGTVTQYAIPAANPALAYGTY